MTRRKAAFTPQVYEDFIISTIVDIKEIDSHLVVYEDFIISTIVDRFNLLDKFFYVYEDFIISTIVYLVFSNISCRGL